jgi:hypothetical protein
MSPNAGRVASWRGLAAQVTFSCSPVVYASETISSSLPYNVQGFVAGYSVADTIIGEDQRALRTAIERTREKATAMERYGTVSMYYIHLSARQGSGERASNLRPDIEGDDYVFTHLARRTSVSEAREKTPVAGSGVPIARPAVSAPELGSTNGTPIIASAQKIVRRCDRKRF